MMMRVSRGSLAHEIRTRILVFALPTHTETTHFFFFVIQQRDHASFKPDMNNDIDDDDHFEIARLVMTLMSYSNFLIHFLFQKLSMCSYHHKKTGSLDVLIAFALVHSIYHANVNDNFSDNVNGAAPPWLLR
jgi:hypothetical protein